MVTRMAGLGASPKNLETADDLKDLKRELIFRSLPLFIFCYKSGVREERALRSWFLGG